MVRKEKQVRIELYFELEKNMIPSDNRAMFVSFLKKTLEELGIEPLSSTIEIIVLFHYLINRNMRKTKLFWLLLG